MKTLIFEKIKLKTILLVLAVFTGLSVQADQVDYRLKLKNLGDKEIAVFLDFEQSNDFTVTLKDDEFRKLWDQKFEKSTSFIRKFNLNYLENGNYYLEIEDDSKLIICTLTIEGQLLKVLDQQDQINKPRITKIEDRVIYELDSAQWTSARISIYDQSNELLFSESFINNQGVRKVFDFSRVPVGKYYIETLTDERIFESIIE